MSKKSRKYDIDDLGDFDLPPSIMPEINEKIEQADKDVEEARVSFRWGKEQVDLIKAVAEKVGVPYQTYIKMVLFRQAQSDLEAFSRGKSQSLVPNAVA